MKYHNIYTEYNGRIYASKKEANFARDLDLRVRAKDIKSWMPQVKFPLIVNGILVGTYVSDFVIVHNDGKQEVVEIKGGNATKTDLWRLKWKLFEALYLSTQKTIIDY